MNYQDLPDDKLVALANKKSVNVLAILYQRYQLYGYAIVRETLNKTSYFRYLYEEKDAIIYDALCGCVKAFDSTRGNFRSLFYSVTKRETIRRIIAFQKDPLSNYVSIDQEIKNTDELLFADSATFVDKSADVHVHLDFVNKKKIINEIFDRNKDRVEKMITLKEKGYNYKEIANELNCSIKTVYEVFYRLRKRLKKEIK